MVDYLESVGLRESAAALEKEGRVDTATKEQSKGLLEKKWTSVLRLQKKVHQLEEELKTAQENSAAFSSSSAKRPAAQALPVAPALHTLKGHRGGVTCVRFHPQYPLLASASGKYYCSSFVLFSSIHRFHLSEDASIKMWDCEAGQFERTLKVKACNKDFEEEKDDNHFLLFVGTYE